MKIKINGAKFDLEKLEAYNPGYLKETPARVEFLYDGKRCQLFADDAFLFDKCATYYLDYFMGDTPYSEEVESIYEVVRELVYIGD